MSFRYSSVSASSLRRGAAFTLVEVLVSMTVLIILLLVSAQVIGTVQSTWTQSNARVSQFREARTAFDIITRNLSQATLNSYIDYDTSYLQDGVAAVTTTAPQNYIRKSDLRFVSKRAEDLLQVGGGGGNTPGHAVFFQAPLGVAHDPNYVGLDRLLCGRGYFVQYTSDAFFTPAVLPAITPKYRYRLMEFSPPAEKNLIYPAAAAVQGPPTDDWFAAAGVPLENEEQPTDRGLTRPIADNIVALIVAPQLETPVQGGQVELQSTFDFDSANVPGATNQNQGNLHRLPPMVRVILVAIDERTADRLSQVGDPATPPLGDIINGQLDTGGAENLNLTMQNISNALSAQNVKFRIFSATVALRGAKSNN
ncbi:Verru_Chthon cassette protein C [Prosthecobacter dejongeii]|uniref:Uncharacterized protein (TIGR02599 family) n=1 Tax=Prosthecobacter dejongeii TaxID=48465 RepID=A0A7W7YLZ5_9BACT|nr:Verru_Chthon cassette protein C [Prosthecobacter dejongeii]MBB5038663.1 uncharacterized protein (TIGR02599 family) [Prosthecobacter dejongeii]